MLNTTRATATHDTWGVPLSRPFPPEPPPASYRLPDGREVSMPWDVCRGAALVPFTLANGAVVQALIQRGEARDVNS